MRIAVLTNAYPPSGKGGAAIIVKQQVELLRAQGLEVRVWNPPISWLDSAVPLRLFFHILDLLPREKLAKEIADWKPDVLLTHNLTGCGFATPRCVQSRGVRWLHTLHDVQLFEPSGRLRRSEAFTLWQKFWSRLRYAALREPDFVISPTEWLFLEHRRRGFFRKAKSIVLPNPGRDVEFVMRLSKTPIQLLFVGQLYPEKGLSLLLQIQQHLRVPFVLHIVGEWRADKMLPQDERIIFHGKKDHDTVIEFMKEYDVLLVPSRIAENQPTVLLEAASVGLPVVASDIGGIRETLQGAGILCAPEQVEEWIDAIQSLSDPRIYREQASSMYDLAVRYTPARHLERLLHCFTLKR